VLVRPEQLLITTNGSLSGVPARVLGVDFHGHDMTVRLDARPDPPTSLLARVVGRLEAPLGATVRVVATGPVEAWPAPEPPDPDAGGAAKSSARPPPASG
jgi:hypothetical protein